MTSKTYNVSPAELAMACAVLFPSGGSFEQVGSTLRKRSESFILPTDEDVLEAIGEKQSQQEALAAWQAALDAGYVDADTGIKLKTTLSAQSQFAAMAALMREGLELGAITNDTIQKVWDFTGQSHDLTTLQTRGLLFRYGVHCKTMFDDLAP